MTDVFYRAVYIAPCVEHKKVPFTKVHDPVSILQLYYDEVIPGGSTEFREFDEYMIETSELNIPLSKVCIDTLKSALNLERTMPKCTVESKLRTNQPNKRSGTQRQMQLAIF